MLVKAAIVLFTLAMLFVLYIAFYPFGQRSAQSDMLGGDARVIALSRPHYIIPREYIQQGGMNPVNFWSVASDPSFSGSRISEFTFLDLGGIIKSASVQGFNINRSFSKPIFKEDVLAIKIGETIFDFPTHEFEYTAGPASNLKFHFVGQDGRDVYLYFPYMDTDLSYVKEYKQYGEAVFVLSLPFEGRPIKIIPSTDRESWKSVIDTLRELEPKNPVFESLCDSSAREANNFAASLLGKECD